MNRRQALTGILITSAVTATPSLVSAQDDPIAANIETVHRFSLTRKEAAAALGVSVDTFERRIQPFIRVVVCGQLILVPPAELERWIKDNARFLS